MPRTGKTGKTFALKMRGLNISITLQPTRKGITIVKPKVSRVVISRGGGVSENPDEHENTYRLIERGSTTGPFLVTHDFGEAGQTALNHARATGKHVWIYDKDGWRGMTSGSIKKRTVGLTWKSRRNPRRNPLPVITTPGRPGVLGPTMLTRTFRS